MTNDKINLRDMPYVRQLADAMIDRTKQTGVSEIPDGTDLQLVLMYLDAISYGKLIELWQDYMK